MLLRFALGEEDREKIVFPLIDRQLHPGYCSTGDHRKSALAHRPACALSGNSILPTPALSFEFRRCRGGQGVGVSTLGTGVWSVGSINLRLSRCAVGLVSAALHATMC